MSSETRWNFSIRMKPTALKRPRVTSTHTYNPQQNLMYCVRRELQLVHWKWPSLEGDVELNIWLHFEMPKTWSKKKKELMAGKRKRSRPDSSNVLKFYEDCMQGIVFEDDAQITDLTVRKRYGYENLIEFEVIDHGGN
jgi:Holliday junction resolvase RusA-like endonuclease